MSSPQVEAALAEWSKGYTPTPTARRHFRSNYCIEAEMVAQRLLEAAQYADLDTNDALSILPMAESALKLLRQLDAQLRRDLAGDALPTYRTKGVAA
ncbi:hypothetical protein [Nocardia aurea]|uniref:hypothetical protein n=1 Tax=Nocardia aurea TaxID=2144174 RepID=UPI0033A4A6C0